MDIIRRDIPDVLTTTSTHPTASLSIHSALPPVLLFTFWDNYPCSYLNSCPSSLFTRSQTLLPTLGYCSSSCFFSFMHIKISLPTELSLSAFKYTVISSISTNENNLDPLLPAAMTSFLSYPLRQNSSLLLSLSFFLWLLLWNWSWQRHQWSPCCQIQCSI